MTSSTTSRLGKSPEEAVKAPCVVETAVGVNINLTGEQTVNGVAVIAGDRVFVKDQTIASENGIYNVATTAWTRAKDWNKANDVVSGTLIPSAQSGIVWMVEFTGTFVPGVTEFTAKVAIGVEAQAENIYYTGDGDTVTVEAAIKRRLRTVDTLAELPAEDTAKFARFALGYPGAGYKSDIQNVEQDSVNSRLFGIDVNLGLSATQFTDRLQTMIDTAGADDFDIELARGEFDANGSVTIDETVLNSGADGISLRGAGSRRTQINYSGTGHFLNVTGDGDEASSPIKRFSLSDMWIYGNANTTSSGGLLIDRAYFVDLQRMYVTGYAKSDAVAVKVTNTFNFMAQMFQFANGFPLPQGQASFQVGSVGPDAWNTSNVVLLNGAIQYGGVNNIEVIHSSGVFDNFVVDGVTLGKSGLNSFKSVNANVNNICLRNNHFESPGYTGDGNPLTAGATHIKIDKANAVRIENNSQQDAYNYIDIDSVGDLTIVDGKYFETGTYTLTGNTLLKIRNTTANVNGTFDANNVRTDQIDNLFDYVESGGRTISINNRWRTNPIESTWNDVILPAPEVFRGQIINRRASSNAPFDQMYSSDGVNWGRMMFSTLYRGERSTSPDGVVTGNAGWFYISSGSAELGTVGDKYTILGWRCQGGTTWVPMHVLTGA